MKRICINCKGIALPYSAFCVDCIDFGQFTENERKKQNEFIIDNDIKSKSNQALDSDTKSSGD